MTIDKAIRVNIVLQFAPVLKDDKKVVEALQLGIEALKREQDCRANMPCEEWLLLPGETEE